MTNQAKTEAQVTPSGLPLPAGLYQGQVDWMLAIDASVTKAAADIERERPSADVFWAQANEQERKGNKFLADLNRDIANSLIKGGPRYAAVCQLYKATRGQEAHYFVGQYQKLLEAAMARQAELAALARHVCFCSQFDPSDDTWAAIKVYRDGNPIIIDDGFATQDEAEDCADLAREAHLAALNKPACVVAATTIVPGEGEFVVCVGDALGPVIGRFPRTKAGHRAAVEMAEG